MLMVRLLWHPLPETMSTGTATRGGAVQALVREAYQATVAEQDSEHRSPAAFARRWQAGLRDLLSRASVELHGWGTITIAEADTELAWRLFDLASRARADAIEQAVATPSRRVQRGQPVPTFEFSIAGDGDSLGDVTYGTCESCRVGLLYKIGFPTDWQYCGLGRLALSQLEARHPDLTWYTTGQFRQATGFYERYRQGSSSPWTIRHHPCPHFSASATSPQRPGGSDQAAEGPSNLP